MHECGVLIIFACSALGAENLLMNPGFEAVQDGMPAHWNVFVLPQLGSTGGLDDRAHDGRFAAMLHNARPYENEPVNNWSQSIAASTIADLGGKSLRLSGSVKAEDAGEAALWLQCWRRPWRLLEVAATGTDMPVAGTQDWREVSVTAAIPQDTDFVVVRCVLLGTGTAWFDDLALEETGKIAGAIAPMQEPGTEEGGQEEKAPAEKPDAAAGNDLREASRLTAEALDDLRATNHALAQQVWVLYEEVERLRKQVKRLQSSQAGTPGPPVRVPPLVPRGYDLEDLR